MKPITLIIIFLVGITQYLNAQSVDTLTMNSNKIVDTILDKDLIYHSIIIRKHDKEVKGFISSMNDSVLFISLNKTHFSARLDSQIETLKYNYKDLEKLRIRKSGTAVIGALIGAAGGGLTGLIIGEIASNPIYIWNIPTETPNVTAQYTLIGVAAGAVTGAIIGALVSRTFKINGNRTNFLHLRKRL